jgi:hypothetical protein
VVTLTGRRRSSPMVLGSQAYVGSEALGFWVGAVFVESVAVGLHAHDVPGGLARGSDAVRAAGS